MVKILFLVYDIVQNATSFKIVNLYKKKKNKRVALSPFIDL